MRAKADASSLSLVEAVPTLVSVRHRRRDAKGIIGLGEADEAPLMAPFIPLVAELQGYER